MTAWEREAARKLNEPAPRNVYDSVAVLARPKLTENEYESATSALEENRNASVVYERLPAPNIDAAHPPPGLVYVSLPPETPGAPPTLL